MLNQKKHLLEKLNRNLVTIVFLGILVAFGLWQILAGDRTYSASERRILTSRPAITLEGILNTSFMADYETYLTDQFPMRDGWITVKTGLGLAMGQHESGGVYITKDQSLIELHRTEEMDAARAEDNTNTLVSFLKTMADSYGTEHVKLMLIPTADAIWAEKISAYAEVYPQAEYLSGLQTKLEAQGIADAYVDVHGILQEHSEEQIYYKTDHHWTMTGAYYGYLAYSQATGNQLIAGISTTFGQIEDYITINDLFHGTTAAKCGMYYIYDTIEILPEGQVLGEGSTVSVDHNLGMSVTDSVYDLDKAESDDPYEVYLGGNDAIATITINRVDISETGKKLLIVKDSYANCFVPYLLNQYDEITLVDLRFYNGSVSKLMADGGYTDLCVLYNVPNFLTERTVNGLNR